MSVVKVSELKNRLSHYLRLVKRGETVLVCDRDRVIARLSPAGDPSMHETDESQWLDDLEQHGVLQRSTDKLPRAFLSRRPKAKPDLVAALLKERQSGR
jgi:antitoxin (DNA-binding transcriptional repressor) of toxin-antitoxin stability system